MEFLFHGSRSQGDVHWLDWSFENPECVEPASGEGKGTTLQRVRSNSNRCQTFPRSSVRNGFRAFAPYATELLSRRRRGAADAPAECRRQRVSAAKKAGGAAYG